MSKWYKLAPLERWKPRMESTWALRTFKQYDCEFKRLFASFNSAKKYTYSHLKQDGAVYTDQAAKYLATRNTKLTIKNWSDDFNLFDNWVRLNLLMSICSYFETYMSSVIAESIESDPGLIFGCYHDIDGIALLKKGHKVSKIELNNKITECVKGDWNSRMSNLQKLYGQVPELMSKNISLLEKIRKLRNEVGHAFGRDIEQSKNYEIIKISAMHKLSAVTFLKYHKFLYDIARSLDLFLLNNHIGNYEPLFYLHNIYETIKNLDKGEKMIAFKKSMGSEINGQFSKDFCRQIIVYYENL